MGRSGLKVSAVGLGCNNFGIKCDAEETKAIVNRALDEGVTLFDTADIYGNRGGSEELLGKALGKRRREVVVASKFGMSMGEGPYLHGASRRYVMAAAEDSLRRLNTDYIDLYQLHTPDPKRRRRRRSRRSATWCMPGRCVTSDAATSPPGNWPRRWGSRAPAAFRPTSRRKMNTALLDRHIERELIPACRHSASVSCPIFRWRAVF